jgi:DNA polymerase-3 subunit delta'
MPLGNGFNAASESPTARLITAGSHPDFRCLTPGEDDRGKRRSVIRVDEVRALQPVLSQTPSLGPWRAILVDSADDLNPNAANALLKSLEEPPPNSLFLLVSHAPGRLLPTIRSRCRQLRFQPLAGPEMQRVLARHAALDADDVAALIRLAGGSPGAALAMAEPGIAQLAVELETLATLPPDRAEAAALALARSLAGKTAGARMAAFLAQAPGLIAGAARSAHGPRRARLLDDWSEASALASAAVPLGLDPQTVALDLARRLARIAAG